MGIKIVDLKNMEAVNFAYLGIYSHVYIAHV